MRFDRSVCGKFADCAKHLQSVSEGNSQVLQMLIGQFGQNLGIDLAIAKCALVLAQAKSA